MSLMHYHHWMAAMLRRRDLSVSSSGELHKFLLICSEKAYVQFRAEVEIKWLLFLSDHPQIPEGSLPFALTLKCPPSHPKHVRSFWTCIKASSHQMPFALK
jgi:hypothetical protein